MFNDAFDKEETVFMSITMAQKTGEIIAKYRYLRSIGKNWKIYRDFAGKFFTLAYKSAMLCDVDKREIASIAKLEAEFVLRDLKQERPMHV